jgi:hypothetical protein
MERKILETLNCLGEIIDLDDPDKAKIYVLLFPHDEKLHKLDESWEMRYFGIAPLKGAVKLEEGNVINIVIESGAGFLSFKFSDATEQDAVYYKNLYKEIKDDIWKDFKPGAFLESNKDENEN